MKKWIVRLGGTIASLALLVTTLNVNSTCSFWIHQSSLPKGAEKLRKF